MTSRASLKQGFSLARRTRSAVWILLLTNLGVAAVAALPIYNGILNFTGHSMMGRELARGLPVDWLTDFSFNNPGLLDQYALIILIAGLLSILVNSILAGGVLSRFQSHEPGYPAAGFFHETSRYAWRMVRLMLIGLVFYWIVFRMLNQSLGGFLNRHMRDWLDDRPVFYVHLAWGILVAMGVGFVNLVMDFARVKLVMEDGRSAAQAFLASLGFALGRLRRTVTVWAIPSFCGLALLGIYRVLVPWGMVNAAAPQASWAHFSEPLTLALLFIGQQAIMFGRYWFRVATWASEWSYYSGCQKRL